MGILQGGKAVGDQSSLGMNGVIQATPICLNDLQGNRYTLIFIAAYYKENNLQYLGVAGNSIVTNSMKWSSLLNNNLFSDGQEIPRILRNPELLLPHSQEQANNPYPERGKPSSSSPIL